MIKSKDALPPPAALPYTHLRTMFVAIVTRLFTSHDHRKRCLDIRWREIILYSHTSLCSHLIIINYYMDDECYDRRPPLNTNLNQLFLVLVKYKLRLNIAHPPLPIPGSFVDLFSTDTLMDTL